MTRKRFAQPSLEGLEQRWLPATIRLIHGSLLISNQTGPLVVETMATPGQMKISDAGKVVVVSGVSRLVSITGTNASNSITFVGGTDVQGSTPFNGNLLINSGNGADTIDLNGRIGGHVTLLTGLGDDNLTTTRADVDIGGNLTWSDPSGINALDMNAQDYRIGGNLLMNGIGTLTMGGDNALQVRGQAVFYATLTTANSMNLDFNGVLEVGRALTIRGGSRNDDVRFTEFVTIGGNLSVALGEGANSLLLIPAGAGSEIGGHLEYIGGGQGDQVILDLQGSIGGNTRIDLGAGSNLMVDSPTTFYFGNVTLLGGSEDNTTLFIGNIAGSLTIQYGNGNNTTTVSSSIGGKFSYRGGNGDDILNVFPLAATLVQVDIRFGSGSSLFILDPNVTLNGVVVGTGGMNQFMQNNAILLPTLLFLNYP